MSNWKATDAITAEIGALKDLLPRVRHKSMFGDDHREAIKAQLAVLESRMNMDAIESAWGDDTAEEYAHNVYESATEAHDWYTGLLSGIEGKPSDNWASLVI